MKPALPLSVVCAALPILVLAAPAKVKVKAPASFLATDAFYLNYGKSPLQAAATKAQQDMIKADLAEIVKFRKEEGADEGVGASHWSYDCDIREDKTKPTVIAFTVNSSSYTGGAHPSHDMRGRVFVTWKNKPTRATLKTMFAPRKLSTVEKLVRDGYNGIRKKEFGGEGMRTEPISAKDLDNFTVSSKGVSFLFPHYVLASYAEGSFEIFVPWSKLNSSLAPLGDAVRKGTL